MRLRRYPAAAFQSLTGQKSRSGASRKPSPERTCAIADAYWLLSMSIKGDSVSQVSSKASGMNILAATVTRTSDARNRSADPGAEGCDDRAGAVLFPK